MAVAWGFSRTGSQACDTPPTGWTPESLPASTPTQVSVTMAFAGDLMVGRGLGHRLDGPSQRPLYQGFEAALAGVDVLAVNLESVLADAPQPWPDKRFHFRLPTRHAERVLAPLASGRTLVASVANNHALDHGRAGLSQTLATLGELGVPAVGGGATWDQARRPRIVETDRGVRIGFLGLTDHCSCDDVCAWAAGPRASGIWHADLSGGDWDEPLAAVRALDGVVDHVVFSVHWGPNYTLTGPTRWMRDFAAALVDAGADVIFGHSAHQILAVEPIDGKTVIYSPGGLLDDYTDRPLFRNDLGVLVRVTLAPDGTQETEVVPLKLTRRGGRSVRVLEGGEDAQEALRRAE